MKVVAHAKGYFGGQIREVDDEFEVPANVTGSWFAPTGEDDEPVKPVKAADKSKGRGRQEDNEPI